MQTRINDYFKIKKFVPGIKLDEGKKPVLRQVTIDRYLGRLRSHSSATRTDSDG